MLDSNEARLVQIGTVTINATGRHRVVVDGFLSQGGTCRDVATLAMVWAIGELQRELEKTLQKPGGGSVAVG